MKFCWQLNCGTAVVTRGWWSPTKTMLEGAMNEFEFRGIRWLPAKEDVGNLTKKQWVQCSLTTQSQLSNLHSALSIVSKIYEGTK
jgi:hypothetical protein